MATEESVDFTPAHLSSDSGSGTAVKHAIYCLAGIGVSLFWTAFGASIAWAQGGFRQYLAEWSSFEAFPLLALGVWLTLVVRSGALGKRLAAATANGVSGLKTPLSPLLKVGVIASIGSIGTVSLISLGFPAHGILLGFMWMSCGAVCVMAGVVTAHAVQMILAAHALQDAEIRVFRYSPARTPELRSLVSYFTSFSLLMTFGYAFALLATMSPRWTGNPDYIQAVRLFWPILYVPACLVVLLYPHIAIHRLIQREKDRTLLGYQQEIDGMLNRYSALTAEEVDRTNALAQLFDRINATPNYVLDVGNATRTILPLAFNVGSLIAKLVLSQNSA
jgi:hypothetical protein